MEDAKPRMASKTATVAGVKRPAPGPSLLPAFEPYSSSPPPLPRPAKRVARASPSERSPLKPSSHHPNERLKYPTPIPTSSTGILSSSPPQLPQTRRRPPLQRSISTLSERAPLASVPTVELNANGEPLMMGRSGKSSHYQLSTNKLISRIHVRATYFLAEPPSPARVEIICNGWNGLKIHCQGKAWDLMKDDSFTSYSQDADIMVDVQDARVLLQWPKAPRKLNTPSDTDSTPSENSPRPLHGAVIHRSPFSSPLRQRVRLESPVSPSPAVQESLGSPSLELLGASQGLVQVYEDEEPDDDINLPSTQPTQSTQHLSQPLGANLELPQSDTQEFSDQDEENDPIIQSFGPFGENLLPRMESFNSTTSPANPRRQAQPSGSPPRSFDSTAPPHESQGLDDASVNPLTNHVVNQLAYSRLSSTPLSTIMNNLPAELTHHVPVPHPSSPQLPTPSSARAQPATRHEALTMDALKALIDDTPCIGEVPRAGKDAAGKPLESEYYYVPERDFDATRREAVVEGLRKPGLRNCRKQHKQYFWRKPK